VRPAIGALLVFVATWIAFWPALSGGWLDWDDAPLLLERQEWRGFGSEQLGWMFTTFHMGPYQPLSWLSYAFDHALWGMDPRGYHLTNVLLHALSAVCLYFLAREMLRGLPGLARGWLEAGAALGALFWAVHPLRVESVAWITERRDCLSGLCFLLALLCWTRYARLESRFWFRLALAAFAASLLAKGLALVLPLVLLVLDRWPCARERPWTRLVLEKWPFWLLALAAGVVAIAGQATTGTIVTAEQHGLAGRAAQAAYALVFYVRKTIWPDGLMVFYPLPNPLEPGAGPFVAAQIALVLGIALLLVFRRRAPAALAAFSAYALIVAPVLGFVQTGSQLVALRYSYLATLPLALLAGCALLVLARRFGPAVLVLGGLLLVPLGIASAKECRVWHDTFSLWERDLALDPADAPARRNLIVAWLDQGRAAKDPLLRRSSLERALEQCRAGLLHGQDAAYFMNAAKVYDLYADDEPARRQHWLEQALAEARKSVEFVEHSRQRLPEAYEACGVILCKLERPAEAVPQFQKLCALDPRSVQRRGMLGDAQLQAGDRAAALQSYRSALALAARGSAEYAAIAQASEELAPGR
jgi:tetratricopeptide (TPR) repeat protein